MFQTTPFGDTVIDVATKTSVLFGGHLRTLALRPNAVVSSRRNAQHSRAASGFSWGKGGTLWRRFRLGVSIKGARKARLEWANNGRAGLKKEPRTKSGPSFILYGAWGTGASQKNPEASPNQSPLAGQWVSISKPLTV